MSMWWICCVAAVVLVSAVTDIRRGVIYNWVVVSGASIGVLGWTLAAGVSWAGTGQSVVGLLTGFGVFLAVYALSGGNMGAGDVKLMGAVGALIGFPEILGAMLFSLAAGGVLGVSLLAWRGQLVAGLKEVFFAMYQVLLWPVVGKPALRFDVTGVTVPFGVAIALGTGWYLILTQGIGWRML